MDAPFDFTKPFKTREGGAARLLAILSGGSITPVVVAVTRKAGAGETYEEVIHYHKSGKWNLTGSGLDLINISYEQWHSLKCTDFVHAVVTKELDPIPRDSNPFHYDHGKYAEFIVLRRGWMVMHDGYDSPENMRPLRSLTLINTRSGQRIVVDLSTAKAVQPVFKHVYYGKSVETQDWLRFDEVPDQEVLNGLIDWRNNDDLDETEVRLVAYSMDGFTEAAGAQQYTGADGRLLEFKEFAKEQS